MDMKFQMLNGLNPSLYCQ